MVTKQTPVLQPEHSRGRQGGPEMAFFNLYLLGYQNSFWDKKRDTTEETSKGNLGRGLEELLLGPFFFYLELELYHP